MASSEQRTTEVAEYAYKFGVYEAADRYMLSVDSVKRYMRDYNSRNESDTQYSMEQKLNQAEVEIKTDKKVTNLEKFIKDSGIDLDVWKVDSYKASSWDAQTKDGIKKLTSVKANVTKKVLDQCEWEPLKAVDVPVIRRKETKGELTNQVLLIGDLHVGFDYSNGEMIPYHDRRIMDIIFQILNDHTFKTICFVGDMADFAEMSTFTKKPEFVRMTQPAINELGAFLSKVREYAPSSEIVYLQGNHTARLERQIIENTQWAYGLKAYGDSEPLITLPRLLGMEKLGIIYPDNYPKAEWWLTDDLRVHHGEVVNPQSELNSSNVSTIFGHVHRITSQAKTLHLREGIRTVTVDTLGCTCHIDGRVPGKNARPSWQQGFGVVELHGDNHQLHHIRVNDGTALFHGKVYSGVEYNIIGDGFGE